MMLRGLPDAHDASNAGDAGGPTRTTPPTDTFRSMPRRTKIVATIGPASREPETLLRMVEAGMDVARLNYSHGTLDEHSETVRRVRDAADRAGRPVAILQDLPGPKLRIGPLREDVVELKPGDRVTFSCGGELGEGDAGHMTISWAGLADSLEPQAVLYLADGSVRLRVADVRPQVNEFDAEVEVGGAVASRQGLNIPGPVDSLPSVGEEDLELLRHGESIGVDMVALSFVQRPQDVESVRDHTRLPLIAKMEKPQAVERAAEIVKAADCVMVARGDLGIELPIERVPIVQKQLLELAGWMARPSITATQMLDSMVSSSRPTRAEVADVANAILDGTDAVMLSQETAIGAYPVGAVEMMAAVASSALSTMAAACSATTPCWPSSATPPASCATSRTCSPSPRWASAAKHFRRSLPSPGSCSKPAPPRRLPARASKSPAAKCCAARRPRSAAVRSSPSVISSTTSLRAASFCAPNPPNWPTSPRW